jgi:AraC-like DNA-binding protein
VVLAGVEPAGVELAGVELAGMELAGATPVMPAIRADRNTPPCESDEMPHIRAAVLTNFEGVAQFVKIDPCPLLRLAGLDASLLEDPESMVPASAVTTVLEEAARQSCCEHFGLLMAETRSLGSLGPISVALAHEPRVGTVIEAMVRYQHLFGDAFQIDATVIGDATFVRFDPIGANLKRQGTELALALFCRCIAMILNRRWSPEEIHFIHSAPADMRIHRRSFSCPIVFDSDSNAIVFSQEALQERNPAGDAELAHQAERLLALIMPPATIRSAADRVRRLLRLLLPEHRGTLDEVAREARVTPRTLQRQLRREGYSFGELLDEVRRELAQQYLSASSSVTEIALMIGYQSSCSFTRWFTTRFGMSPLDWRHLAAAGA